MVLAVAENTYGDTGGFCVIPGAKNIYARGMELDKYITKIGCNLRRIKRIWQLKHYRQDTLHYMEK